MPATMSSRTSASADGFDSRTSSSVSTMIPATFVMPSVFERERELRHRLRLRLADPPIRAAGGLRSGPSC